MDQKEVMTYTEFLAKFKEKSDQVFRIKKELDKRRRAVLYYLKRDITKKDLLDELWEVGERELRIRGYIKNGLDNALKILDKLNAKPDDIKKLKFAIECALKEVAIVTSRLRKEKKFVKNPTPENFKSFMKAYDDEYFQVKKMLKDLRKLEFKKLQKSDLFTKLSATGPFIGLWIDLAKNITGPEAIMTLIGCSVLTIMLSWLGYMIDASNLEEDFRAKYGLST